MTRRRLSTAAIALGAIAYASSAFAQASGQPTRGYVEGNIQSAFGNVTSQSFGGEVGITIDGPLQIFVEGGHVRDATQPEVSADAQAFAAQLSQSVAGLTYQVREPVNFGAAGIRYLINVDSRAIPYVLGAIGAAQVKHDVAFSVNGTDVTSNLSQYNAVLGSGLSGSETKAMLVLGGGFQLPVWQNLIVDLQFRYGRIFTSGSGMNVSRAGVGIGVRF